MMSFFNSVSLACLLLAHVSASAVMTVNEKGEHVQIGEDDKDVLKHAAEAHIRWLQRRGEESKGSEEAEKTPSAVPISNHTESAVGSGRACCRALTLDCLACAAGLTAEEYCRVNPDLGVCGGDGSIPALPAPGRWQPPRPPRLGVVHHTTTTSTPTIAHFQLPTVDEKGEKVIISEEDPGILISPTIAHFQLPTVDEKGEKVIISEEDAGIIISPTIKESQLLTVNEKGETVIIREEDPYALERAAEAYRRRSEEIRRRAAQIRFSASQSEETVGEKVGEESKESDEAEKTQSQQQDEDASHSSKLELTAPKKSLRPQPEESDKIAASPAQRITVASLSSLLTVFFSVCL